MFIRSISITGCGALVAASLAFASPASAQDLSIVRSRLGQMTVEVSYRDLNLLSEAGQATLHRRVRNAVTTVCGADMIVPLREARMTRNCQSASLQNAQAQIDRAISRFADAGGQGAIRIAVR